MKEDFRHFVMVYFEQLFFSQNRKKRCGRGPRAPLFRAVLDLLTCFSHLKLASRTTFAVVLDLPGILESWFASSSWTHPLDSGTIDHNDI